MELVIFVGLQGAGKSTFYRERFDSFRHISKDLMRNTRYKQRRQMQLLEMALAAGESVVIDNTNPTVADRAPLIRLGHIFSATIAGYYFTTPLAICLERNRARESHERVPNVAIFATRKRLEIPTLAEGFDTLWEARTLTDGMVELFPMADTPHQTDEKG